MEKIKMALIENKVIDQITVDATDVVFVREVTIIENDGAEVAKTYKRWSLNKGQDVSDQTQKVQDICAVAWK
jgi:hypothetical protein